MTHGTDTIVQSVFEGNFQAKRWENAYIAPKSLYPKDGLLSQIGLIPLLKELQDEGPIPIKFTYLRGSRKDLETSWQLRNRGSFLARDLSC